jgi:subtilisin family serine protease
MRFPRTLSALAGIALGAAACTDPHRPTAPRQPEEQPPPPAASLAVPSGMAVVVFKSETSIPAAGVDLVQSLGGVITSRFDAIGVLFAAQLTAAALEALRQDDLVLAAGPDYTLQWLPGLRTGAVERLEDDAVPNTHDPSKASRFSTWQWGPQRIQADRAWAAGHLGTPSTRVAILDTGIDYDHRELRGLVDLSLSKSFVPTDPVLPTEHPVMDLHFHGTHVASTVATRSVTIAGVAPHVTLIGVKVLSYEGSGTFEGVIGGIMHATDVDAHVINMSLGAEFDKKLDGAQALIRALRRSIQYAHRNGTLVVSAAGNSAIDLDNSGTLVAMPCEVSTLCISATGPLLQQNHDQPAYYTNYGITAIHLAAPGGNANPDDPDRSQGTWQVEDLVVGACSRRSLVVPQCHANNDLVAFYIFAGGTSMATPHVSGAAALLTSQYGGALTPDELVSRLTQFADDVNAPGPDVYSNHGRVNVYRAITSQ